MPTEKLLIFDEAGNAKRVKARLTRFLENEPVQESEKSAIRSTLGITSNGGLGDLLAANNLDDVASAATSRSNLDVNSVAQDAEANATKLVGPSMRFDGSNDYVSFAAPVGSAFSFTNGTDDTAFAVAGWCKLASGWNTDQRTLLSKFDSSTSLREWRVYLEPNYKIYAEKRGNGSISGNSNLTRSVSNVLSDIDDKWVHICVVWLPAGPNSADAFTSAKAYIYVNGKLNVDVQSEQPSGPYVGMTDTAGDVRIGSRQSHDYWDGEIRDVKIFNKELSAAEVKTLCLSGSLPESFAESTGTAALNTVALANSPYASNQFGTVTGASTTGITAAYDTGNSTNRLGSTLSIPVATGKRYKITFNANTGGQSVRLQLYNSQFGGVTTTWADYFSTSTLESFEYTFTSESDAEIVGFLSVPTGAGSLVISDFRIIQIGSVLDARAEQFDTSTGKLYDLSGNDFVGTQSGGVSLLGREFPVYETGTWNGVYSPATGTFATMTMDTSLVYTRIGNLVTVTGFLQTDNVDITGGSGQLQITGLPFAASVVSTCQVGFAWNWGSSFPLSGYIVGSSIRLLTRTSTTARTDNFDVGGMSTGALANRNTMYISATYQIS